MGLISTAKEDPPYLGFDAGTALDFKTADPVTRFQSGIGSLGLRKGCPELVFEPIMLRLNENPSFLRKDAVLAIMALTDTSESPTGIIPTFENFLKSQKGDLRKVRFYGTFAGLSFPSCPLSEPRWQYPGSPFEYFINLTHGNVFSLCDADFGDKLAKVGEDMTSTVTQSRIGLTYRPQVNTMRVSYRGKDLPGGPASDGGRWFYDFDLNAVTFYDLEFTDDEESFIDVSFDKAP